MSAVLSSFICILIARGFQHIFWLEIICISIEVETSVKIMQYHLPSLLHYIQEENNNNSDEGRDKKLVSFL